MNAHGTLRECEAFLYFADLHDSIIIILKASLKWVPLVGPAMQFFDFIVRGIGRMDALSSFGIVPSKIMGSRPQGAPSQAHQAWPPSHDERRSDLAAAVP
jgi:hypothetical protein